MINSLHNESKLLRQKETDRQTRAKTIIETDRQTDRQTPARTIIEIIDATELTLGVRMEHIWYMKWL